jgi:hypothetical protein
MKKWFLVSFKYSDKVYCTNLCVADSVEDVEKHYSAKYDWVSVKEAAEWEVDTYRHRGMPVIKL